MAGEPDPADIPGFVWQLLDNRPSHLNQYSRARFATREIALDALSAALILWAKSQPHPARLTTSPVSIDMTTG
jgi:hypothetical protein